MGCPVLSKEAMEQHDEDLNTITFPYLETNRSTSQNKGINGVNMYHYQLKKVRVIKFAINRS
jgi:hypothetical protein